MIFPRRRRSRGRRGYALVTSLILMSILATVGAAMFAMADAARRITQSRRMNAEALSIAMGGLDYVCEQLVENDAYEGLEKRSLGNGTVSVTVTTPAGFDDRRIVTSTGTLTEGAKSVSKTVRATMDKSQVPEVFYNALASRRDFTVNGTVLINSAPNTSRGNIHSNENVLLKGSAVMVDGNATATGTLSKEGSPVVTGREASGVAPMPFPDIDAAFKEQALADGLTSTNVTVSDGSLIQGKIAGNLIVNTPLGCKIDGVVWVTGNVTVRGPVIGRGTLICDGRLTFDARFDYPVGSLARILYITTSTDATRAVDLGGNRQFKGMVYAPYGTTKLSGTPNIYGNLVSNTITFSGTPSITRYTEFDSDPPPFPRVLEVRAWEEVLNP